MRRVFASLTTRAMACKSPETYPMSGGDALLLTLHPGAANIFAYGDARSIASNGNGSALTLDPPTNDHMLAALGRVQARHPRSRAWMRGTAASSMEFVFADLIAASSAPSAPSIMPQTSFFAVVSTESEMQHVFEGAKKTLLAHAVVANVERVPIAPVVIYASETQCFRVGVCASHVLTDMQGTIQLLQELVLHLGNLIQQQQQQVGVSTSTSTSHSTSKEADAQNGVFDAPPPNLVDLLPAEKRGLYNFLFHGGIGAARSVLGMGSYNTALAWQEPGLADTHCRTSALTMFTSQQLQPLLQMSKANKTTVHGALCAVMLSAHARLLSKRPEQHDRVRRAVHSGLLCVPLNTAVDARRRIREPPLPRDMVSNLSLAVGTLAKLRWDAPLSTAETWELARAVMQDVNAALERKDYASIVWMAESMPQFLGARMLADVVKQPFMPLSIGNAGVVAPLSGSVLQLQFIGVAFATFARSVYGAFVTHNDVMTVCFASTRVGQEDVDALAVEFKVGMEALLRDDGAAAKA